MKKWQCKVCYYTHEGDAPPGSCPVCGVAGTMFMAAAGAGLPEEAGAETHRSETTKCSVCGYTHTDGEFPENCPVCGVTRDNALKINVSAAAAETPETAPVTGRWHCRICGYIHTGTVPPVQCPVCGADRSEFIRQPDETAEPAAAPAAGVSDAAEKPNAPVSRDAPTEAAATVVSRLLPVYHRLTTSMARQHIHPISVHIPNGVLPVAFIFLVLGILFDSGRMRQVAGYNLFFVCITLPAVLFSGYNDWQIRLGGRMTRTIQVKIVCGAVVMILSLVLVVWRFVQPGVLAASSSGRMVYLAFFLAALAAAAVAGFFGGKLIRFPGDNALKKK